MVLGLIGTYEPKLDEKGRFILPAKLREKLGGEVILTRGQERCIYVFTATAFENMHERLAAKSDQSKSARLYARLMYSAADDQQPDKQGRISVAAPLREYAGLERDLTVIGAGNRVEIWDRKAWNDFLADSEDVFSNVNVDEELS